MCSFGLRHGEKYNIHKISHYATLTWRGGRNTILSHLVGRVITGGEGEFIWDPPKHEKKTVVYGLPRQSSIVSLYELRGYRVVDLKLSTTFIVIRPARVAYFFDEGKDHLSV